LRRDVLAKALAAGVGAIGFLAASRSAHGAKMAGGDVGILNYALTLEYLQSAFYTEAERLGALKGPARVIAKEVGAVERAHVRAFESALGRKAVKRPLFNFGDVTGDTDAFLKTAVAFEDLAVAAYKGQAASIDSPDVLATALAIHSVEARHAAWARYLLGVQPAVAAFDKGRSSDEINRVVASTGFIVARPSTNGTGTPKFTG
jgi:Ferritin-like domain